MPGAAGFRCQVGYYRANPVGLNVLSKGRSSALLVLTMLILVPVKSDAR